MFLSSNATLFADNRYRGNRARYGGAVAISHACFPQMRSEEFASNEAGFSGGAVFLETVNSYMECADR